MTWLARWKGPCPSPIRSWAPLVGVLLLLGPGLLAIRPPALLAQQPSDDPSVVREIPLEMEASEPGITPGGAFLRSVLVPGWGHIASESYNRAGFYVTVQTGSLWMLWQTLARRSESVQFERAERRVVGARLRQADPDASESEIRERVDEDPAVLRWSSLVEARDQQVEDWSALSIFLVLLGATDAFVAAHLADYPEPLTLQVIPRGSGVVEVGVSFPMGGRPGRP